MITLYDNNINTIANLIIKLINYNIVNIKYISKHNMLTLMV